MKGLLMGAGKGGAGKSPVCKVCGDESSGFHYGVDSCEGCKGFFRRCITTGMTHSCANDEKCEITPFTRNSCQYCRLKKCFQVGMAREASRLGRRPKRLKEVSGESSRQHTTNLPIAPYPSIQELTRLRMAELQKLIQSKGTETSDLMKLYLTEAQHSFLEHSKKPIKMGNAPNTNTGGLPLGSPNTTNTANSNNAYLLANTNTSTNNNNHLSNTTGGNLISAGDINLNVRSGSSGNLNMSGIPGGDPHLLSVTGSPSSSMQAPSPFLDLGVADLSPLPGGINLNLGFDTFGMPNTGDGLNGNTAYSPSTQSLTDHISNSPMIMPNLDNLDPCSPSEFFTGNMTTTTTSTNTTPGGMGGLGASSTLSTPEPGASPVTTGGNNNNNNNNNSNVNTNMNLNNNNNNNNNNSSNNTNVYPTGASVCPPPNLDNLKINVNTMMGQNANFNTQQQQQQQYPHLLSPSSIKQEPTDTSYHQQPHHHQTTQIKSEPPSTSETPEPSSNIDNFSSQNRLTDVDRILAEAQMTPEASRLLLLNQVTDIIVEAHMGTTINTHNNVADAKERIAGRKLDPNDMIPDMSRLSLSATDLWQQFLTALVPEITKVVKFSKKLPAFSDFPQTDQIKLIKQGAFEVMVARYSILVDEVNELMLDPKLEMMSPRHVIGDLPMGPFLDEFFIIAKQFNPLRLSDGEIGLFTAILMICPDRQGLENREAISRIQDLILQALYLLMKQNTTRTESPERTFRSLITMISQFRKVNDDHARFLNNIKMRSPSDFNQQFPALHQEVFDDSIKKSMSVE